MSSKVYQAVENKLIALFEQGDTPWSRTWKQDQNGSTWDLPRNASGGYYYRGINAWVLLATQVEKGYPTSNWMTYNQADKLGGQVRKGEKGTAVIFWKHVKGDPTDPDDHGYWYSRYTRAFNVHQIDGLPEKYTLVSDRVQHDPHHVYRDMPNPPSLEYGGNRAFYSPARDHVQMPGGQFETDGWHDSVLFHELVHSTGHSTRCNRVRDDLADITDLPEYDAEELVAEFGAAMLCALTGIENERTLENSAAYLRSWGKHLRDNPGMLTHAASRAQRAVDYILGKQIETESEDN